MVLSLNSKNSGYYSDSFASKNIGLYYKSTDNMGPWSNSFSTGVTLGKKWSDCNGNIGFLNGNAGLARTYLSTDIENKQHKTTSQLGINGGYAIALSKNIAIFGRVGLEGQSYDTITPMDYMLESDWQPDGEGSYYGEYYIPGEGYVYGSYLDFSNDKAAYNESAREYNEFASDHNSLRTGLKETLSVGVGFTSNDNKTSGSIAINENFYQGFGENTVKKNTTTVSANMERTIINMSSDEYNRSYLSMSAGVETNIKNPAQTVFTAGLKYNF